MSDAGGPTTSLAGCLDGRPVREFTLSNRRGMRVEILEFGAILRSISVPDARGRVENVALGRRSLAEYVEDRAYLGAVVGRFANRIEDGAFMLDGRAYSVTVNEPPSSVHGGASGFDKKIWKGDPFVTRESSGVRLRYTSPTGEEGYPGTLDTTVVYELRHDRNNLSVHYIATTDEPTIVNLTNHTYFNLEGEGKGTILGHLAVIEADHYLPLRRDLLPIGTVRPVAGTPMDLRRPRRIGEAIHDLEHSSPIGGYDHNFVLRPRTGDLTPAATLLAPESGRSLAVWTTQPAVDFYTGNYLDGDITGPGGARYAKWSGVAIEPEHVSNSPNLPSFPSTVLRPGETYLQTTEFRFGIVDKISSH